MPYNGDTTIHTYTEPRIWRVLVLEFVEALRKHVKDLVKASQYNIPNNRLQFSAGSISIDLASNTTQSARPFSTTDAIKIVAEIAIWASLWKDGEEVPSAQIRFVAPIAPKSWVEGELRCGNEDIRNVDSDPGIIFNRRATPEVSTGSTQLGLPSDPATYIRDGYFIKISTYSLPRVDSVQFLQFVTLFRTRLSLWQRERARGNPDARVENGKVTYNVADVAIEFAEVDLEPLRYFQVRLLIDIVRQWATTDRGQLTIPSVNVRMAVSGEQDVFLWEGTITCGPIVVVDGTDDGAVEVESA